MTKSDESEHQRSIAVMRLRTGNKTLFASGSRDTNYRFTNAVSPPNWFLIHGFPSYNRRAAALPSLILLLLLMSVRFPSSLLNFTPPCSSIIANRTTANRTTAADQLINLWFWIYIYIYAADRVIRILDCVSTYIRVIILRGSDFTWLQMLSINIIWMLELFQQQTVKCILNSNKRRDHYM